jgi:hypothetical protein
MVGTVSDEPIEDRTIRFGEVIEALRYGSRHARARRLGWNGKGMWIRLVSWGEDPDSGRRRLPFLEFCTAQGELVPWQPSQTDVLATDWHLLGEGEE